MLSRIVPSGAVRSIAVWTALIWTGAPLQAQTVMDTSTIDLSIMQTQQQGTLFQSIDASNALASSRAPARRERRQPRAPAAPSAEATTFRSVARSLVPAQIASAMGRDPRRRAVLEEYLTKTLGDYRALAARAGAKPNDVARAAAFVVATCYDTLHGERSFDEAAMVALRSQMTGLVVSSQVFGRMDDRRRQEAFERFAIVGMHVGGLRQRGRETGNRTLTDLADRMARRQLEAMFRVPADRVVIDGSGLRF